MGIKEEIGPFLDPDTVAVIGASRSTGPGSFNAVENMIDFGYDGEIVPVNPKADEVLGRKAFSDIREVDQKVDHAMIIIPRQFVPDAVEGCGEQGIEAVTIASQGFADVGGEGSELQDTIGEIAEEYGIRIVGPNTLGIHNPMDGFTTSFIPFEPWDYDRIGLASQSGLWCAGFPDLKYGKIIDVGNACDVDQVDAVRYFGQDDDIDQIFLHIEGLRPGRGDDLIGAAEETVEGTGKPVIALKSAESDVGRKAVESHTGSLAGEDEVYDGAFKQGRIVRVRDYSEAQIVSKAFRELPPMDDKGVAMVTHHGASGVMALDAIREFGLELADLSEETTAPIQGMSPGWMEIDNPMDIWPALMGDPHGAHEKSLKAVLEDENAAGVLLSIHVADLTTWDLGIYGHIEAVQKYAPEYEKPVISVPVGVEMDETVERLEEVENSAVFPDIRAAARAFDVLSDHPEEV